MSIEQLMVNLTSSGKFSEVGIIEVATDPKDPSILTFRLGTILSGKESL